MEMGDLVIGECNGYPGFLFAVIGGVCYFYYRRNPLSRRFSAGYNEKQMITKSENKQAVMATVASVAVAAEAAVAPLEKAPDTQIIHSTS